MSSTTCPKMTFFCGACRPVSAAYGEEVHLCPSSVRRGRCPHRPAGGRWRPPLRCGTFPFSGPPPKPSGGSGLCRWRRSEGSGACGDAVTVRLFATPGFPPPRAGLRAARAALRSPSLRSIRAAHNGSPLLFYPISGQKERGVIPLVLFGLFTSPRR